MDLYDKETKTGWMQRKNGTWVYMENGSRKPPGTDAWRFLKRGYKSMKDNPVTNFILDQLEYSAQIQGEGALLRAQSLEAASKEVPNVGEFVIDAATDLSNIPTQYQYHPDCLETFGELCTVKDYNQRMLKHAKESIFSHWNPHSPGGVD